MEIISTSKKHKHGNNIFSIEILYPGEAYQRPSSLLRQLTCFFSNAAIKCHRELYLPWHFKISTAETTLFLAKAPQSS